MDVQEMLGGGLLSAYQNVENTRILGYLFRGSFDFIRFYGLGEILDSSVYGKAKRRKSEYIFCSVTFDEGYKSYYYLTNDDSIER